MKSNLAKIKAAKLDESIVNKVEATETRMLFSNDLMNGNLVKILTYEAKETSLGIHSTGMDIKAPALFSDVEIIHKNGIKLTTVKPNRIKKIDVFFSLRFLFIEHPFLLKDHLDQCYRYNDDQQ